MSLARNRYLLFLILLLIIPSCKKEELISTPDITISLEGEYDDLCTNENNEILIIGSRMDNDPYGTNDDLVILKTNNRAQIIWEKDYKIGEFIKPYRIVRTTSGNYFIAIQDFATPNSALIILQIDEEGEILHQLNYVDTYLRGMIPDPDGELFFAVILMTMRTPACQ
jgi:hypothetical protein